jgi:hypothetical protein
MGRQIVVGHGSHLDAHTHTSKGREESCTCGAEDATHYAREGERRQTIQRLKTRMMDTIIKNLNYLLYFKNINKYNL